MHADVRHRGTNRSASPDVLTLNTPPPNPYADDKIPAERELFIRLLSRRLRIGRYAEAGMTTECAAGEWTRRTSPSIAPMVTINPHILCRLVLPM